MQNTSNPSELTIGNGLNALTGNSGHENGNGQTDGKHPAEIEITADSDVCLFTSSPSDSPRLDGDFIATVGKSCWHAEDLTEAPYDAESVSPMFGQALANRR